MVPSVAKKLEHRYSLPLRIQIPRPYLVSIARLIGCLLKSGWSGVSAQVSSSLKGVKALNVFLAASIVFSIIISLQINFCQRFLYVDNDKKRYVFWALFQLFFDFFNLILIYYINILVDKMGNSQDYPAIRRETINKRLHQFLTFIPIFQKIITEAKISPEQVEAITRMSMVQVVESLNSAKVTSQLLVAIFGLRAATIGSEYCIITEDNFNYALKAARACDEHRLKSGKRNWTLNDEKNSEDYLPPLYGVPISIKDNIDMEGLTSTVGLTSRANTIIQKDCSLIFAIKNAGMIPLFKTNLPQLAMNFDSNNFLWGRACNPWNKNKSVGGSSGGQGAALAARMSLIGVGNDLGGSLRIPAAFCGITALLSGQTRIPSMGSITKYSDGFSGMDLVKAVTGPMSTSVDALALWMSSLTQINHYKGQCDPYIQLHPFDIKLYKQTSKSTQKLKIGFISNLQMIQCTPACHRGLMETVQFLRSQGHQLIEIELPNERQTIFSFFREISGEGGLQSAYDMLQGEKLVDQYKTFNTMTKLNKYIFRAIKCLIGLKQPRLSMLMDAAKNLTTHEYLVNSGRAHQLKSQWIAYWRKLQIDFVVCPGFGSEATNHGMSDKATLLCAYTFIWNILAMSSCSVPVTVTREDEQYYQSHWDDEITQIIKKTTRDSAGLPVNVQIVGLPFTEEKVLGFAKKIEDHFQFLKKHPFPNLG